MIPDPASNHRGNGYSWQLAADLIATLADGCQAVVAFPSPLEGSRPVSGKEYDAACARPGDYWSRLGFHHAPP